jgi:hypothetical protein
MLIRLLDIVAKTALQGVVCAGHAGAGKVAILAEDRLPREALLQALEALRATGSDASLSGYADSVEVFLLAIRMDYPGFVLSLLDTPSSGVDLG